MPDIRLTQFSSAAGCGCKIDAVKLGNILSGSLNSTVPDKNLFVGNNNNEDAAAYCIDEENLLLSTVDFFTPIVDNPYEFGFIAAANAMSDIYAMGGRPIFALSILGWPMKELHETVAMEVIRGSREACANVGITIAGGHSIENKEPVFGLSVNGMTKKTNIKLNNGAKPGDLVFLTKPLGAGILATAIKRNLLLEKDYQLLLASLKKINSIGYEFGKIEGIHAMTDVTGFGLAGHLGEVCQGSNVSAKIFPGMFPVLTDLRYYIEKDSMPGGLHKNWKNYSPGIDERLWDHKEILADPQTNGGLLVCLDPASLTEFQETLAKAGEPYFEPIGEILEKGDKLIV